MPLPVLNKCEFYRRWREMEFGNRIHSYDTASEILATTLPGPFAIRYKIPGSKWMQYHIPRNELETVANRFINEGARKDLLEFSEMQQDQNIRIQGELQEDHRGRCLFISTDRLPMRQAMVAAKQYYSPLSETILAYWCDPDSLENLYRLLDQYPGHVIEFSTYSTWVGVIPRRNTIVWEVRKY